MRKLTVAQIAAMTASLGIFATTAARYGIPLVGLSAIANAGDTNSDDELEEVVVTGTRPGSVDIDIYTPGTSGYPIPSGGGVAVPTAPPLGSVKSTPMPNTPMQKNAEQCAMQYSVTVSRNVEHAHAGQRPDFTTVFVAGVAYGANDRNVPVPFVMGAPDATHSRPIDGYTSFESHGATWNAHTAYIFPTNVANEAPARHTTFQANLVNTVVHEWEHSWWSPWDDDINPVPRQLGDAAQALFVGQGGISAPCWVRPPRNGGTGGNK